MLPDPIHPLGIYQFSTPHQQRPRATITIAWILPGDLLQPQEILTFLPLQFSGGRSAWAWDKLPMNEVLCETLQQLWQKRSQNEWVFLNPKTGTRYMHRPKLMATICKRAGVRHFGFHAIRHFVASYLADKQKFSITQVSRLLRHQSKATTERYLQAVDPQLREVMASLEEKSHTTKRPMEAMSHN
jgi:hypothetical protein